MSAQEAIIPADEAQRPNYLTAASADRMLVAAKAREIAEDHRTYYCNRPDSVGSFTERSFLDTALAAGGFTFDDLAPVDEPEVGDVAYDPAIHGWAVCLGLRHDEPFAARCYRGRAPGLAYVSGQRQWMRAMPATRRVRQAVALSPTLAPIFASPAEVAA